MGDLPLMTDTGSFVINGAERVIVSQLVRSPGIYYTIEHDKVGKECYFCQVIPNRGAWLEYETDSNDVFNVRVDRTRKVPVTVLLRALGLGSNDDIKNLFGDDSAAHFEACGPVEVAHAQGFVEFLLGLLQGAKPCGDQVVGLSLQEMLDGPSGLGESLEGFARVHG